MRQRILILFGEMVMALYSIEDEHRVGEWARRLSIEMSRTVVHERQAELGQYERVATWHSGGKFLEERR